NQLPYVLGPSPAIPSVHHAESQGSQVERMTLQAMRDTRPRIAGYRKWILEGVICGYPLAADGPCSLGWCTWRLLSWSLLTLFGLIFSRLLDFGIPSPQIQPPRRPQPSPALVTLAFGSRQLSPPSCSC
ncbi:mCG140080, isoform CRA_a, partial [Mus musculus]